MNPGAQSQSSKTPTEISSYFPASKSENGVLHFWPVLPEVGFRLTTQPLRPQPPLLLPAARDKA